MRRTFAGHPYNKVQGSFPIYVQYKTLNGGGFEIY